MKKLPTTFQKNGEKKKFKVPLKVALAIGLIVILIIVFLYSTGRLYKDCKEDLDCFYNKATKCHSAKVSTINSNNWYDYQIIRKNKEFCEVKISLIEMGTGSDAHLIDLFEGKEMFCQIPKEEFAKAPISDIKGLTNYCSGELKESIQQLVIEKLYKSLIEDMKKDIEEANNLLEPSEI